MSARDLANPSDLKIFLQDTPFAFDDLQPLSGGTANFACRLKLASPYEGRSTVVLKHGKPYVFSSKAKFPFGLERQKYEVEALGYVKALISPSSFVTVPAVHLLDEKENIIIMDDCGDNSTMLKQFILENKCTPELAEEIGTNLGEFLHRLHGRGSGKFPDIFATNEQAKQISAWATYGRLVSTVNGEDPLPTLSDPPLHIDKADLQLVSEVATETQAAILSAKDTFVMGDFWPGNILVAFQPETGVVSGISVIDWELAKSGLPGLDLGQFCAEIDLIRRFHPSLEGIASKIISSFYRSYSQGLAELSVFRTAAVHWGVHLVAWTPRISWGSRKRTRETVEEGVKLIVQGHTGPESVIYERLMGQVE